MANRTLRTVTRWLHLAGAAIIGTYIYSPWSANAAFAALVEWAVVPLLGLTGLLMWQQAQVSKLVRRFRPADRRTS